MMLQQGDEVDMPVKLDRAAQVLQPRSLQCPLVWTDLCKIHHYPVKDLLSQRAWDHGPYNYKGGSITLLPDLSRATLQRRALLRPLVDQLKQAGIAYR